MLFILVSSPVPLLSALLFIPLGASPSSSQRVSQFHGYIGSHRKERPGFHLEKFLCSYSCSDNRLLLFFLILPTIPSNHRSIAYTQQPLHAVVPYLGKPTERHPKIRLQSGQESPRRWWIDSSLCCVRGSHFRATPRSVHFACINQAFDQVCTQKSISYATRKHTKLISR